MTHFASAVWAMNSRKSIDRKTLKAVLVYLIKMFEPISLISRVSMNEKYRFCGLLQQSNM